MKPLADKQLLLSLIKDDLICTRLVNGLNSLGLSADDYLLHLNETILRLMGYEAEQRTPELYRFYDQLSRRVNHLDITRSHSPLDELAAEIYYELYSRLHQDNIIELYEPPYTLKSGS